MRQEYIKKGQCINEKKLERNLLEKASRDYVIGKQTTREKSLLTARATRQAHYEKNLKKK